MNYALLPAAGSGSRMGAAVPKQFLPIGGEPIYIKSLRHFIESPLVDGVVIAVPEDYIDSVREETGRFFPGARTDVIAGGADRSETLEKLVDYLFAHYDVDGDSVILTHDAVRPFIDERIIADNIAAAKQTGGCGTAIPAVDTVFRSADGVLIDDVPPRAELFYAQTPQSFRAVLFREALQSLTKEQKSLVTDACSVFLLAGMPVKLVPGKPENIKITYPSDLQQR